MSAPPPGWTGRVEGILGLASSAILLGMMLLTFADVVARYLFTRPVRGAFEVTELLLLVLIFAGLPLVSFTNEHAVMDFIDRLLDRRARRGLERVVEAKPEFVAEVRSKSAALGQDWIKAVTAKGVDGAKALADFRAELAKVAAEK